MSRRDFLVEIGTEELPPLALKVLANAFAQGVATRLDEARLRHGRVQRFASPRRLAVLVKGVAEEQPAQEIKRRGPPVTAAFDANGAPTRAAQAFAESCGTSVAALGRVTEPKGEFLFFTGRKPGGPASELLPRIVTSALDALPIPKRMRWGSGDAEFVRPVHWVVLLFGRDVLPARILDVQSGQLTHGHRFHAPRALRIGSPGSYVGALLKRGYVMADFEARREKIRSGVLEAANALGGSPVTNDSLLDEVTALVEWPVPLTGRFEERFLALPREVLIATLQDHQRYFPVAGANGELLPAFIAVSNIESRDPDQVRAGNERVVRPRLSDAAFFYETDRKQPLAARRDALAGVTFQTKLGSLGDKARRIEALAAHIAGVIGADPQLAQRAAQLCKCDLLTAMVGEFPELQGTMGRYYAQHDSEPAVVAEALAEHYLPRFAGDALPAAREGMAVAIADKLDTIVGIFAIDQKPSGTRDPFGLRRAALGLVRIAIEQRLAKLDLIDLIDRAARAVVEQTAGRVTPPPNLTEQVYDYIMERLRAYYLEGAAGIGLTTEMFDAVLATRPSHPVDFDARLKGLGEFLKLEAAASLTSANKRIANILRKATEPVSADQPDRALFRMPNEGQLFDALAAVAPTADRQFSERHYAEGLSLLASLRAPVDAFFDKVLVMDQDAAVRANRLRLLQQVQGLFLRAADLSRLPG